jgi:hypothetical protein
MLWMARRVVSSWAVWKEHVAGRRDMHARAAAMGQRALQRRALLRLRAAAAEQRLEAVDAVAAFAAHWRPRRALRALAAAVLGGKAQRALAAAARQHYLVSLRQRALRGWAACAQATRPVRELQRRVDRRRALTALPALWLTWRVRTDRRAMLRRVFTLGAACARAALELDRDQWRRQYEVSITILREWHGWATAAAASRRARAAEYTADSFACHRLMARTWRAWCNSAAQRKAARAFAARRTRVALGVAFGAWRDRAVLLAATLQPILHEYLRVRPLRHALHRWRLTVIGHAMTRRNLLRRVLRRWATHTAGKSAGRLQHALQLRRTLLLRAMARHWRCAATRTAYLRDAGRFLTDRRERSSKQRVLDVWQELATAAEGRRRHEAARLQAENEAAAVAAAAAQAATQAALDADARAAAAAAADAETARVAAATAAAVIAAEVEAARAAAEAIAIAEADAARAQLAAAAVAAAAEAEASRVAAAVAAEEATAAARREAERSAVQAAEHAAAQAATEEARCGDAPDRGACCRAGRCTRCGGRGRPCCLARRGTGGQQANRVAGRSSFLARGGSGAARRRRAVTGRCTCGVSAWHDDGSGSGPSGACNALCRNLAPAWILSPPPLASHPITPAAKNAVADVAVQAGASPSLLRNDTAGVPTQTPHHIVTVSPLAAAVWLPPTWQPEPQRGTLAVPLQPRVSPTTGGPLLRAATAAGHSTSRMSAAAEEEEGGRLAGVSPPRLQVQLRAPPQNGSVGSRGRRRRSCSPCAARRPSRPQSRPSPRWQWPALRLQLQQAE